MAKELIAMIFRGELEPGNRLPAERELSRRLKVSRGTIRDALAGLEELDVVETRRGSGTYVRRTAPQLLPLIDGNRDSGRVHLDDVLFARQAIEVPAFQLACSNARAEHLKRLEAILDHMRHSVHSIGAFVEHDMEFHHEIVRASGNPVLTVAFEAIRHYHRFSQIYTSYKQDEVKNTIHHHERILGELKSKRSRLGSRVISDHFADMRRYISDEHGAGSSDSGLT